MLRPTAAECNKLKWVYVEDANYQLICKVWSTESAVSDLIRFLWGGVLSCIQRSEACVTLRWHK